MTRFPLLLLAAVALAGPAGPASAAGSTPPTYAGCAGLGLTDQACHRRIVQAGGTSRSASNSTRSFTVRNFRGWTDKERWYRKYVEYRKRFYEPVLPMDDVDDDYPDFPGRVPFYFTYP